MRIDYTHITMILDRSGSMESIKNDVIGGFNSFLKEQQNESGFATLTLVQFDSQNSYEVIHRFRPIKEVNELTAEVFVPRASTPLYDAIGRGINDLQNCIKELPEKERPVKIVFVILTDGEENSSREFNKETITRMINDKQERDFWQFVFLSSDLASFEAAKTTGFHRSRSVHCSFMMNQKSDQEDLSTPSILTLLSESVSKYRSGEAKEVDLSEDKDNPTQTDKS